MTRADLLMVLVLVSSTLITEAANRRVYLVKFRTRPREIRGFKPDNLSTAIGFGKREGEASKLERRDRILSSLLRNFPRGTQSEWLMRDTKADPGFEDENPQKLTRMPIDEEITDSRSIIDYLKPDRTISMF